VHTAVRAPASGRATGEKASPGSAGRPAPVQPHWGGAGEARRDRTSLWPGELSRISAQGSADAL